jgi:hypothetical protein
MLPLSSLNILNWSLSFLTLLSACTKSKTTNSTNNAITPIITTPPSDYIRTITFNRPDGSYSSSDAAADFGVPVQGTWQSQNVSVYQNSLRVRIPANSIAAASAGSEGSGNIVRFDVPDDTAYEISYRIKFDVDFLWSRGGKLGFGFLLGEGNTGCDKADDGNGGSVRIMWYNSKNDKTNTGTDAPFIKPYIYYKDMPDNCGDDFNAKSLTLQRNQWYNITIGVKSNTDANFNGTFYIKVDDAVMLQKDNIRFTTNTANRIIKSISFATFRGGSQDYWAATKDGFIYYDDVKWRKLTN